MYLRKKLANCSENIINATRIINFIDLVNCMSFLLLFLQFSSSHVAVSYSSTISKLNADEKQIGRCAEFDFHCDNDQCIHKSFLCDGISDCDDNSDETYYQCHNVTCGKQFFQCDYGACIDKEYRCDGFKQCADGSDELPKICGVISDDTVRKKRQISKRNDMCPAFPPSEDKNITYECSDNAEESKYCHKNGVVPKFTVARIKCNANYSPTKGTYFRSICHERTWIPEIDSCYKICDKLSPINVDLKCYRQGANIPCDTNKLLAGTRVRPTCRKLHTYKDFVPNYRELVCQYNGKWDNMLFSCVPECGRAFQNPTQLISGGTEDRFADSPWHVAIYNQHKVLICGGTIVHPYLVISAAHCFYGRSSRRGDEANYEVVVSKFSRNYDTIDNQNQRTHKLREIRFSNKGYYGVSNYFAADIAILILKEKITTTPTSLPACIDWTGLNVDEHPPENTPAKVVGWGLDENGRYREELMAAHLPFISRERCLSTVPDEFKAFITFDKFCAGSDTGPSVQQGDSGGGLLFRERGLYFLRGIVSLRQPTSTSIATFTDLADHIEWILSIRNEIEQEMLNRERTVYLKQIAFEKICNKYPGYHCRKIKDCPKANDIIINRRAVFCGYNVDGAPRMCCPIDKTLIQPTKKQYKPRPVPVTPDHFIITLEAKCEKYSEYTNSMSCPSDEDAMALSKGPTKAMAREYPHMALIGYGQNFKDVQWLCVGSLVSEKFILSSGRCSSMLGEPKWVLLGDLNITSTEEDARPAIYTIVGRYNYPFSEPNASFHNIALYELNTTAEISAYVRPACLSTLEAIPVGAKATITGWGTADLNDDPSDHLLKATVTIVDDDRCKELYQPGTSDQIEQGYTTDNMFCAGDWTEGKELCVDVTGSPLQIRTRSASCMWIIVGISSYGLTSCGNTENSNPYIYAKVAYDMDWIQNVIWPEEEPIAGDNAGKR